MKRTIEIEQAEIRELREKAILNQHKKNKLSAEERLKLLYDGGEYREILCHVKTQCTDFNMQEKKVPGDGIIAAYGFVNGRLTYSYAQDFSVLGGSLGLKHAEKIMRVLDLALKNGAPVIGLNDSGGARIQEGVESLAGYAGIFYRNTKASGVIPQISAIMGPCAGGAVYSPALTDFVFINKENAYMFLTGPEVVKAVTGEKIGFDDLGGSDVHTKKSGVAHFVTEDDEHTIESIKTLLSYIPQNNLEDPPYIPNDEQSDKFSNPVPDDPKIPYDTHELIENIFDEESFFEVQENFAKNIVVGFARLAGYSVGLIANNPSSLAGVLDINASVKASRFIRFCDCFNIPIISLIDVPGFLPGSTQEHNGVIRNGAKLLFAYCEATVPKIGVIIRKAYGGAYCVMSSKHIGADFNFAWPNAEIAVMGAEGACNIVFRKDIAASKDPSSLREKLTEEYRNTFANPFVAAELGYIDEVIKPEDTRNVLIDSLISCLGKRESGPDKKHGNFPV